MINSQILKHVFFSNGNLLKQLDNFFQTNISVDPYNTRSVKQLHIPKINTVKYGTVSLSSFNMKQLEV